MFYLRRDCCVEMLFLASGAPRQGVSDGINQILFLMWDPEEPLWPFSQLSVVSSFKLGLMKLIYFKKGFLLKPVGI